MSESVVSDIQTKKGLINAMLESHEEPKSILGRAAAS